ncbi:hypothetical protein EKO27_g5461 [Xylaria grammica]|uniref:Uncharacterized protein n=1 Tax=Xylaria grammica TaxID=363999 RepID=A0A439D5H5_9PEZI|nr:hypothetical protein EKO27_g5461 [Xylaria grammica]
MVPEDDVAKSEAPLYHYLNYFRVVTDLLKQQDVMDDIAVKGFMDNSDVKIMFLSGKTMPHVFGGGTTILKYSRTSGLLDEYYSNGFGTKRVTVWMGSMTKQLTSRSPHLNPSEIGMFSNTLLL